jgi:RHS repeat-associated protein
VDDYPTGPGGAENITRYSYDGWDPSKAASTGLSRFDIWADLDGQNNNALLTRYIRDDNVDGLLAPIDGSGNLYFTLTDRQGSVVDVTDNSGVVKDAITYDGWGQITNDTNITYRGRYGYTGREEDQQTGPQYNRARYYDPVAGRWITQDPLGFDAGDSNLYRYSRNQSTYALDPSGDDFIAVTGRAVPIFRPGGKVQGGHYVLEYWKCPDDPPVGRQFTDAQFIKERDRIRGKFGNDSMKRLATVELTQSEGWEILFKNAGRGSDQAPWCPKKINIAHIDYDASVNRTGPNGGDGFDDFQAITNAAEAGGNPRVKKLWSDIITRAKIYAYAEQPGWDKDPNGADIKNWPNSYYEMHIGQIFLNVTNNSNTFVWEMVRAAGLKLNTMSRPLLTGRVYGGRDVAEPVDPSVFNEIWKRMNPFDPLRVRPPT